MNLHQLRCFLAAQELGSFTRAAAALHMTQPSLSYAILSLERDLGNALFVRHGRGVLLTRAGEAFVAGAREAVRAAEGAREAVSELASGRLTIAVMYSLRRFAAALVSRFLSEHPGIVVSFHACGPDEALELVRSSAAPLALCPLIDLPENLKGRSLFEEEVVVIFPPGTRPPASITADELARTPLIVNFRHSSLRARMERVEGVKAAPVAAEANDMDFLVELVLNGIGAAVVSSMTAIEAVERGAVAVPFAHPPSFLVGLVHRAGPLSPLERSFRAVATAAASAVLDGDGNLAAAALRSPRQRLDGAAS